MAKEIKLSKAKYGEAAQHIQDAQKAGHTDALTVENLGSAKNRYSATGDADKVPGKQLDEYPPAMFREGWQRAIARAISPSDNMAAGACIGNACRSLKDGDKIRIIIVDLNVSNFIQFGNFLLSDSYLFEGYGDPL